MFQQSLYHWALIAALLVLAQDLSSTGGAQAWTYSYNISTKLSWSRSRKWCQENFIDMVPGRNQEEIDFLEDFLPYNPRYYWIGVRRVGKVWTWAGINKEVPEEDQNWAPNEPDDNKGNDCVEIYVKTTKAKWNDENCGRKKGTVCYSASCAQDSCSALADCVETIGNYSCQCHPGFTGPRCEEAITCKPVPAPKQGFYNCSDPFGSNHFNSSCQFYCDVGFRLVGQPQLLCQASGYWDHPFPLCQVEQCPALNDTSISGGGMNCSHPIAHYSYNSTCEVRCDKGYELIGQERILCDHAGQWTASIPACAIKRCSPIVFAATGNVTCVDTVEPFSFGSRCDFTCGEGYYLEGDSALMCLATGQWSNPTPTCTVVRCNGLEAPPSSSVQCLHPLAPYSYGSVCVVQCEEGFDLTGTNVTKCTSQGNWSQALPVCEAKRCPSINSFNHGTLFCSNPHAEFSFGSQCRSGCDEGFLLNGTVATECTSLGTWSADVPHCLAKRCPPLSPPTNGSIVCTDPHVEFSFGSQCTSGCDEGFLLTGTAENECTSMGTWSTEIPTCQARLCPLLVGAPQHGRMNCSHPYSPFSYESRCDFECHEGFTLRGPPAMRCKSSGHWSQDVPTCQPVQCEPIAVSSLLISMNCSNPLGNFSFGSQCVFTCRDGFSLNGTDVMLCSSNGLWNDSLPICVGWPVRNSMLLSMGVGAASVVLSLILIGLALLIFIGYKTRGTPILSDVPVPESRENPAFEF